MFGKQVGPLNGQMYIEIKDKPLKLVLGFVFSAVIAVFFAVVVFMPDQFGVSLFKYYVSCVMLLPSVLLCAVMLGRILKLGDATIRLTPEHLWRADFLGKGGTQIPWALVESIEERSYNGVAMLSVVLKPNAADKVQLPLASRWMMRANSLLGEKGILLNAAGSSLDHDAFKSAVMSFFTRATAKPWSDVTVYR